jgi:hypothetical protein
VGLLAEWLLYGGSRQGRRLLTPLIPLRSRQPAGVRR